jgi:hypothetical protein
LRHVMTGRGINLQRLRCLPGQSPRPDPRSTPVKNRFLTMMVRIRRRLSAPAEVPRTVHPAENPVPILLVSLADTDRASVREFLLNALPPNLRREPGRGHQAAEQRAVPDSALRSSSARGRMANAPWALHGRIAPAHCATTGQSRRSGFLRELGLPCQLWRPATPASAEELGRHPRLGIYKMVRGVCA